MDDKQRQRYIRWQDYRITQLSFSINLFLGFAVASLAFAVNQKLKGATPIELPLNQIIRWWSASASLGCVATVARLLDFRYTARKIKDGGTFNSFMAKWLGPITWCSFWGQLATYAAGAYFFVNGMLSV